MEPCNCGAPDCDRCYPGGIECKECGRTAAKPDGLCDDCAMYFMEEGDDHTEERP